MRMRYDVDKSDFVIEFGGLDCEIFCTNHYAGDLIVSR
jgi:hypothetical protein